MQDLIERLEKATEPDRELDIYIGNKNKLIWRGTICPAFTASIDAALTLVPTGWAWSIRAGGCYASGKQLKPRAELAEPVETEYGPGIAVRAQAESATPAIAICIAALKARAAVYGDDCGYPRTKGAAPCDEAGGHA